MIAWRGCNQPRCDALLAGRGSLGLQQVLAGDTLALAGWA